MTLNVEELPAFNVNDSGETLNAERTVTGTVKVVFESLIVKLAVPILMAFTVTVLPERETVATPVLELVTVIDVVKVFEMLKVPVVPTGSDRDVGETVIGAFTVTARVFVPLLSLTETVAVPAFSPVS